MTDEEKSFIKLVKTKCEEHNVELILKRTKKIKISEDIKVGGYFEEITKKKGRLVCAMNHPQYLSILVHEFSHMEQWIEQIDIWKKMAKCNGVDDWLEGKNIRNVFSQIDTMKMLELDCEKRSIQNIKKYNLPIDVPSYIQKANSYVLFYNYLKKSRKWSKPGNAPFSPKNESLWSLCPKTFRPDSYYETIPKKIHNKFIELGI